MSNAVYRFRPEKRIQRSHRRGDRVRVWRLAAEAWKREAEGWRQLHERHLAVLQKMVNMERARWRSFGPKTWFFFGSLAGAAVMAFVK